VLVPIPSLYKFKGRTILRLVPSAYLTEYKKQVPSGDLDILLVCKNKVLLYEGYVANVDPTTNKLLVRVVDLDLRGELDVEDFVNREFYKVTEKEMSFSAIKPVTDDFLRTHYQALAELRIATPVSPLNTLVYVKSEKTLTRMYNIQKLEGKVQYRRSLGGVVLIFTDDADVLVDSNVNIPELEKYRGYFDSIELAWQRFIVRAMMEEEGETGIEGF